MSANPTRVDWKAATSPLQEGNRVLESIARQEAMAALLAFSSLHEQIHDRHLASERSSDGDLIETERFILDEVLQLICDRAQAITQADGIVVALAEKPAIKSSEMVCRAAAGPLAVGRGVHLIESEFLQDCLESGRILRCDDCRIEASQIEASQIEASRIEDRVELDFGCPAGVRSTVLVPLLGRREQLGVLQAFSKSPRAFTDQDIRCFDLFAELVLSALRPEDQDRRIHWLSDVADEVLGAQQAVSVPVVAKAAIGTSKPAVLPLPDLEALQQPIVIPATMVELPEPGIADERFDSRERDTEDLDVEEPASLTETLPSLPFLQRLSLAGSSHPGLSVVMGLVAVAALFSAGAWWGMQEHEKASTTKVVAIRAQTPPQAVTAPPSPADVLSPAGSDNLMNLELGADASALAAVAEGKLAALPKITGVRHWSSVMGSTVVIDMEDQVPYEVHRLMSPERIYFDLHDTVLSPELNGKTMDIGDASLTRVRIAQPVAGVTRIVLDTKDGSNFSVSMESSPYRLVVELRGSDKALAANKTSTKQLADSRTTPNQTPASVDAAPAPLKTAPEAALEAKASDQPLPARTFPIKTGKFRIVLDAGHGGWDLGTVGRQGLLEKDLVLDVTQRLGKLLQARLGSEVMFTRTGDTYVPLDQRADFANAAQADLFVSVHANYSNSSAARGVETYYTNLFSAPGWREIEKHDDGTFATPTPVSLSVDGLHDKIEESRRLATSVQHSLYATLAAKSPDIRNRGIKDSAFAVLTGTTMPAILTEISFVSSPADEHNLQTATYRQQIAEALYQGIASYQQSSPHARVAQLQAPNAHR